MGVGKATELVVHAHCDSASSSPTSQELILQLDFENAFNSLNRMLLAFPSLSPFIQIGAIRAQVLWFTLMQPFYLLKVSNRDPLGPILFAFGTLYFAEAMQAHARWQCWFLDYGHLTGSPTLFCSSPVGSRAPVRSSAGCSLSQWGDVGQTLSHARLQSFMQEKIRVGIPLLHAHAFLNFSLPVLTDGLRR